MHRVAFVSDLIMVIPRDQKALRRSASFKGHCRDHAVLVQSKYFNNKANSQPQQPSLIINVL